ncbi:hypothetical protein LTR56_025934 [Elasticomyces elasticus]|nr:hypothetical protein LTR56_025934 [Elasticomyces elasticus]KAK5735793.1 hypothetical protein LTS12_026378 [Elasticomyces elasticus]
MARVSGLTEDQETSPFAFTQIFRGYNPGGFDASTVTPGRSEWDSVPRGGPSAPPLSFLTVSHIHHAEGSAATSESMDTLSRESIASSEYAFPRQRRSPNYLIQAAEALEEQASSLRQLASRRSSLDLDVYGVQQHAPLPPQMSQPSNLNQLPFGAPPDPILGLPYQFDLSTIIRPDGTLRTGYMPTGEPGTWDVNMM